MPHTFFSLNLGPYDSEEAVATLPGQLDLLHAFRDLARPGVSLIYRLQTALEPSGDLSAIFRMMCVGRNGDVLSEAEHKSLLDHAAVVLIPAWSLTHIIDDTALPRARHRVRLRPSHGPRASLPIKPDWAPIVDLVRRRETPITVDLGCTTVNAPHIAGSTALLGVHHHVGIGSDNAQRHASEFFCAIASSQVLPASPSALAVHLSVYSDEPIDNVFLSLVGRLALGLPTEGVTLTRDVLFPRDPAKEGVLGQPEEVLRVFHPPYGHIEGRGLEGTRATSMPIRFEPTGDGAALGRAIRQGGREDAAVPVRLSTNDRLKHVYVVGKTGSGKTNFLKNLVRQDIDAGHGVAVIDPHGPLVDHALRHAGQRVGDVVLLDFSHPTMLPILNPLLTDVATARDQERAVEELLDVLIRRSFNEFTGPVFEDTVRMMLSTVTSPKVSEYTSPSIAASVDLLRNSDARKWVRGRLADTDILGQQWETFNAMMPHTIAEHVRWVLAKFAEFSPEGVLFPATGGEGSPLSFESIFRDRKILLVKIPEAAVGKRAASILGSIVFSRLHRAARTIATPDLSPFYVHVDEFQKFVDVELEEMVAEARKFNLGLTFAHQNLRQLDAFSRYEGSSSTRLREAIFSNVGTMICMRTSGSDVHAIAQELGVSEGAVRRLRQYDALVRPVVGGVERETFVLNIPNADDQPGDTSLPDTVEKAMVSQGFWATRVDLEARVTGSLGSLEERWRPQRPTIPQRPTVEAGGSAFLNEYLERRKRTQGSNDDQDTTDDYKEDDEDDEDDSIISTAE